MQFARIAIVKAQPGANIDEALRRARDSLAPLLASRPGFIAYELVRISDDRVVSISHWQSRQAAEDGQKASVQWMRANLGSIVQLESDHVGEVQVARMAGQKAA